jgi:glycosyltransferase involved in cell wall biosynthesis
MDLTVCICTRDRPAYLQDCLRGLQRQTVGDRFDILVVDSASDASNAAHLTRIVADILPHARLQRVEQPGISLARNIGAQTARSSYIAYIDDDAIPAPDWVERIAAAIAERNPPPALIGGRIMPRWEAPLPLWWPRQLRGTLSIIEYEGQGEYRTQELPPGLEPYGANIVVHVQTLRTLGGFGQHCGRDGKGLLSDEDIQLAWRMQAAGHSARYDSRIVVEHQIQASRLTPAWLLSRLYWQGVSTVRTRRQLGRARSVWWELPRRFVVAAAFAPTGLLPRSSDRLLAFRWRLAYATGFLRAALGDVLATGG